MGRFRFTNLSKVEDQQGLYSWSLAFTDPKKLNAYSRFYRNYNLTSIIKGNLKMDYEGQITMSKYNDDVLLEDKESITNVSLDFAPPIYIGISKNLKKRISQHQKQLLQIIESENKPSMEEELDSNDLDTLKESKYFAMRLGNALLKLDLNARDLIVKTTPINPTVDMKQIQQIEKYFNRVYNPVYGRK